MAFLMDLFKKSRVPFCSAVVVAAGNSTRMEGTDKIMAEIGGRAVIARTLDALEQCRYIREIVVVTREDLLEQVSCLCSDEGYTKVVKVIVGGEDRPHSVSNGLKEISKKARLVAIHDGARPFVTKALLEDTIKTAVRASAVAPAVAVTDTVKIADKKRIVTKTPDRSSLYAVQTPQVFDRDLISGALKHCLERKIALTDDCSAVEAIGKQVLLTQGDVQNIKITTSFDLAVGEAIVSCRKAN